jgi:hypothetical protein
MDDLHTAMMEWAREGYCCSQIMILAGLAYTGRENPDLVASLGGLCKGGYVPWGTCGALSGACCLLGFYAGKGSSLEQKDPRLLFMAEELHRWFRERWGTGGERVGCGDILGDTAAPDPIVCSSMVAATLEKTLQLLVEQGFGLQEGRPS